MRMTRERYFASHVLPHAKVHVLHPLAHSLPPHAGPRARWAISVSSFLDSASAPRALQLQLRYLTKDFLRVLNVSDGEKSFVKFSTRRKILC
jgi:hypothetical protein